MEKKLKIVAGIALIVAIAIAFIAVFNHKNTVNPEKITLAVAAQPISAPVYVAYEKGFFKEEGLQVSLPSFGSGKDALALVLQGKAAFCTVAETPLVFAAINGKSFHIVATMAESTKYMKIVARKDRGIRSARDLSGKRIGVTMGTNAEYYLACPAYL
jgi:NitT/TauT family transport system substrate-binding protein